MENKENETAVTSKENNNGDPFRMLYVLLVVLIICGGNGIGIISAALIWKFTGNIVAAVICAVVITVIAFACGMLVVVYHNKKNKIS